MVHLRIGRPHWRCPFCAFETVNKLRARRSVLPLTAAAPIPRDDVGVRGNCASDSE